MDIVREISHDAQRVMCIIHSYTSNFCSLADYYSEIFDKTNYFNFASLIIDIRIGYSDFINFIFVYVNTSASVRGPLGSLYGI